jgi:dolichol-phosphate mannosyltransferase
MTSLPSSSTAEDTNADRLQLTVVVPTFKERGNIVPLVNKLDQALAGVRWEVVFVDDDSPDGTADAVRALSQRDARVRVIQRIGRRGLASACVEGALSSAAPVIAVMDADLQHDETILPAMLRRLTTENLDLVIASRYTEGGSTQGWDATRLMISRFSGWLARSLFHVGTTDPMSGFFMLRREAFNRAVRDLSQQGFKILFDLMASATPPFRYAEMPYHFSTRQHGDSKLDGMAAWQFGVMMLDKLIGRVIPVRFLLFVMVGGSGVAVHVAALYALLQFGTAFGLAQAGAVLIAMTSNFFLNNAITYRDQRLRGGRFVVGLLTFYLVCSVGAAANVGIAEMIYASPREWWVAGLAGAAISAVWKYAATRLFTWRGSTAY